MPKYKGTPIVYDYWVDTDKKKLFALVEWTELKEGKNHSNVILMSKDCNNDKKTI